jgi:hypothetical protein
MAEHSGVMFKAFPQHFFWIPAPPEQRKAASFSSIRKNICTGIARIYIRVQHDQPD